MRRDNKDFTPDPLKATAASLGNAIKMARIARATTRRDCAERARISSSTLARIERGDVSVSFSGWLVALEQVGLFKLIEPALAPQNDVVGEAKRGASARKRASKARGTDYDF